MLNSTIYALPRNHEIILVTSQVAEKFQLCGKIIPRSGLGVPLVISLTSKKKKKVCQVGERWNYLLYCLTTFR